MEIKTENNTGLEGGLELACPCDIHGELKLVGDSLVSECCGSTFQKNDQYWDLLLGDRFNDDKCECMWSNEEKTGRHLAIDYVVPLLKKIFPDRSPEDIKILSIGCGVGSDVEALNSSGYSAYGVDVGNRSEYWSRRTSPERYTLANAKHLPFPAESIDVILMGCVLPHIGVGDDTYVTEDEYQAERQMAANEMVRVSRPGGVMLLSSPNRNCPLDFFHRANVANHMPRFHSPRESFLMSRDDYAVMLGVGTHCKKIELLPLRGYWGFYSSSTYMLGRLLQLPVKFYFNHVLSWSWTRFLRNTAFNPWLIILVSR